MTDPEFFRRNYVWAVYFEDHGPIAEVTLTYDRALPDGDTIKFDEDPDRFLDIANDADERVVMDGFLALIPNGELLSCSMRDTRHLLLIFWGYQTYKHFFVGYDKQVLKQQFDRRLFNTDGGDPDIVFAGGERAAHTPEQITRWAKVIKRDIVGSRQATPMTAWQPLLDVYRAILYTDSTEIHLVTRNTGRELERARAALAKVARGYRMVLPPEPLPVAGRD